jgi:S-adenosylmethionine:tRNA ribosyltransferase-isomerase
MSSIAGEISSLPLKASDFNYDLPQELIAQYPALHRSDSRLMVFNRQDGSVEHQLFLNLPELLREGDLLILNDTQVIPARLFAQRDSGKIFEILLLELLTPFSWKAMIRSGKEAARGDPLTLLENATHERSDITATVVKKEPQSGDYHVLFERAGQPYDIRDRLVDLGAVPLPPYIERAPKSEDIERYQTVFCPLFGFSCCAYSGITFYLGAFKSLEGKEYRDCIRDTSRGSWHLCPCEKRKSGRPSHA